MLIWSNFIIYLINIRCFFTLQMYNSNKNLKLENKQNLARKLHNGFIEHQKIEYIVYNTLNQSEAKEFQEKVTNRNFVLWIFECLLCLDDVGWINNNFKKIVNLEVCFKFYQLHYVILKENWWDIDYIITDYTVFKSMFLKALKTINFNFKSYNNIIITQDRFLIKPYVDIFNIDEEMIILKYIQMYESNNILKNHYK